MTDIQARVGLVQTDGGLLVPIDAIPTKADGTPAIGAADSDGRRRIVLTKDDQRRIDKAIKILNAAGLGIIVACRDPRPDGAKGCGQALLTEGRGGPDAGYGCQCSRIHFL